MTLSPYLGFESLRPALDLAAQTGRGVFVLALTSNPEGASVQHVGGATPWPAGLSGPPPTENRRYAGQLGAGPPAVVGATVGSALTDLHLDLEAVRGPILLRAWARRAPPLRICAGRSARRTRRCWERPAGTSSAPVRGSRNCATPPRTGRRA